jgi:hypothetical protein
MTDQSSPRWYSFRLWQLFAVITLIGCYLGYQVYVVRERKALLEEMRRGYAYQLTTAAQWQGAEPHVPATTVPYLRRLLGDEAVQQIGYYAHMKDDAKLRQISRTFPEAKIYESSPPLEPCHPGCFPHGTLISTPGGIVAIDAIQAGDTVYSVTNTGEKKSLVVASIFRTHNRLWNIETEVGLLRTTETQPLCVSLAAHQPAGELQPGDSILIWSDDALPGQEVQATTVLRMEKTDDVVPVINLVLGNREPFIANGYLARSKPPKNSSEFGVPNSELKAAEIQPQTTRHH